MNKVSIPTFSRPMKSLDACGKYILTSAAIADYNRNVIIICSHFYHKQIITIQIFSGMINRECKLHISWCDVKSLHGPQQNRPPYTPFLIATRHTVTKGELLSWDSS